MTLAEKIEGILFYKAEPVAKNEITKLFSCSGEEVTEALTLLRDTLSARGIRLLETEHEVVLVTAPELSELLERMRREELKRDIGKAGAETLSVILYRGPVTRTEIDFIRGVNSSFILRNLMIRGLVMREQNKTDQRTFQYHVSPELLRFLGVTRREDLPEYQKIQNELDRIEKETQAESDHVSSNEISTP